MNLEKTWNYHLIYHGILSGLGPTPGSRGAEFPVYKLMTGEEDRVVQLTGLKCQLKETCRIEFLTIFVTVGTTTVLHRHRINLNMGLNDLLFGCTGETYGKCKARMLLELGNYLTNHKLAWFCIFLRTMVRQESAIII